ncbi:MAG TPA: hypothetical protein VK400_11670 [Pyrinomonadaceae bacterium]|nr:hypothetical protein [Pyrinomonadaceae bacterium]
MENPIILIYVNEITRPGDTNWYPVEAVHKHDDCYRIVSLNPDPEHVYWEFYTDDVVRCETIEFAEGEFGLVARSKCNDNVIKTVP